MGARGVRMRTKHRVNQGRYWLKCHSLTPTERLYFFNTLNSREKNFHEPYYLRLVLDRNQEVYYRAFVFKELPIYLSHLLRKLNSSRKRICG